MKIHIKRLLAVPLAVSAATVLSGCGGDADKPSTEAITTPPQIYEAMPGFLVSMEDADARAETILKQMTLEQKIQLVHGTGMSTLYTGYIGVGYTAPTGAYAGVAGFVPGIPELGIPDNQIVDSGSAPYIDSKKTTALPAGIAMAASWDRDVVKQFGARISKEARTLGLSTTLGGGINLARDMRAGRNFEYMGEDPILAGELGAARIIGGQEQHVMGTIKHYAFNYAETNRLVQDMIIDEQTMRETEMLSYEIVIEKSHPAYVMCAYNRVNGSYACENEYLLSVLKDEWGYQGMVISDWGATHSTVESANAGLDEEQPGMEDDETLIPPFLSILLPDPYFTSELAQAVIDGEVPLSRLDDMVKRKLRMMIGIGLMDDPVNDPQEVDQVAGRSDAYEIAASTVVLMRNEVPENEAKPILPLADLAGKKVAVIGMYADKGMVTGGGSAGVKPLTENKVLDCKLSPAGGFASCPIFVGDAPINALRDRFPEAEFTYFSGKDLEEATTAAAESDLTIVFGVKWGTEITDNTTIHLNSPEDASATTGVFIYNQDELISAVSKAAPKTIAVLEIGTGIAMPWKEDVDAIINMWYPGVMGAQVLADVINGTINPSGKLPVTFVKSIADQVNPAGITDLSEVASQALGVPLPMFPASLEPMIRPALGEATYDYIISTPYTEQLMHNGYKWCDINNIEPEFHFGFGLSYTTFDYTSPAATVTASGDITVTFELENTGYVTGQEVAQVYVNLPDNVPGLPQPPKKLVGWEKVKLEAGERKNIAITIPRKYLSVWDIDADKWVLTNGTYDLYINDSADLSSKNMLSISVQIDL